MAQLQAAFPAPLEQSVFNDQLDNYDLNRVDYKDLPERVLRFEVQYQRSVLRRLEKKLDTDNPSELLWYLMQKSEKHICKHFEQFFADV